MASVSFCGPGLRLRVARCCSAPRPDAALSCSRPGTRASARAHIRVAWPPRGRIVLHAQAGRGDRTAKMLGVDDDDEPEPAGGDAVDDGETEGGAPRWLAWLPKILETLSTLGSDSRESAKRPSHAAMMAAKEVHSDMGGTGVVDGKVTRLDFAVAYTPHHWSAHRSSMRYITSLMTTWQSKLIRGLAVPLGFLTFIAAAVCGFNSLAAGGFLPFTLPTLHIPMFPYQIASSSLGLLLVFRSNAAYERYWEARTAWDKAAHHLWDLVRQGCEWVHEPALRAQLVRHALASVRTLKMHVRASGQVGAGPAGLGDELAEKIKPGLTADELRALMAARHKPLYLVTLLSAIVGDARMPDGAQACMDGALVGISEAVGICDKLLTTPIPTLYTKFSNRFLMLWLSLVPFVLWPVCGWFTVPATFFMSIGLLGIEDLGVQIEEPFTILPLHQMCTATERNISEVVNWSSSGSGAIKRLVLGRGVMAEKDGGENAGSITRQSRGSHATNGAEGGNGNGNGNGVGAGKAHTAVAAAPTAAALHHSIGAGRSSIEQFLV